LQRLRAALIRLQTDLLASRASWALIGGLAVSARAEPRTTRDIDVSVLVSGDLEAERIVSSLFRRGYQVESQLEQEATQRLATMRLRIPGEESGGVIADLLFASSGIEPEVVAAAEALEVMPGLFVPVARTGHLLALKVLALDLEHPEKRPQDLGDIRELLRVADGEEVQLARSGLDLITRRGFDRGTPNRRRDLRVEFEDLLTRFANREGIG
jgi:Nucleotidyl transferase AbiEii toxin, Type IV TA system